MQIHLVERVPETCSFALLVLRFDRTLTGAEQTAARRRLAAAGVIDEEEEDDQDDEDEGEVVEPEASCFVFGNWAPRSPSDVERARGELAAIATAHGGATAWIWPVATHIDAFAGGDEDEDEDSDEDEGEGSWQFAAPPQADAVPFPCERFPEMIDEFDGDDLGIAIKLGGPALAGEADLLTMVHRVWLMHYIDPRAEERPFRNAAATFDVEHRSCLLWVDRFGPPVPSRVMVRHLLAVVRELGQIVPIVHARFTEATMALKYASLASDAPAPFVLAGNPLRTTFADADERAAVAWAESQRTWSPRELAAMYVELGEGFDPDEPAPARVAVRMFDRAAALDPDNSDAQVYPLIALVRSGQLDEAFARARAATNPYLRTLVAKLVAEHRSERLAEALDLLDAESVVATSNEAVCELVAGVANTLPDQLARVLALLPDEEDLVSHLHAAAFKVDDQRLRLTMLEKILELSEPSEGAHRTNYLSAHNNACIIAHALGDYPRARALADRAQAFASENPYIFHSAACAYAAVGELDKALAQVEQAIAHDYDHLDRVEVDSDLGELLNWPQFKALFAARRERRAKSEPVIEADSSTFAKTVLASDRPVLVDFTASWCGPCKRQAPIVAKLAAASEGKYRVVAVDIDASPDLAERYDATSVPTLVVFSGGTERARTVGLTQANDLRAMIDGARGH